MPEQSTGPSAAYALECVRRFLPGAREVTARLDEGLRHVVFEIDGRVVVKLPRQGTLPSELATETQVLSLARAAMDGLAPQVIGFDLDAAIPYVVMTKLDGVSLLALPLPWPESLLAQVAEALGHLHAVAVPDFVETLDQAAAWRDGISFIRERRLMEEPELSALDALYESGRRKLAPTPLVLVHGDFWPHHCVVDVAAGRLLGLIDFGDAIAAPRAWEFASRWHGPLERGQDRLFDLYAKTTGAEDGLRPAVHFFRLLKAVRTPRWSEEHNLAGRGARSALRELRRQIAAPPADVR